MEDKKDLSADEQEKGDGSSTKKEAVRAGGEENLQRSDRIALFVGMMRAVTNIGVTELDEGYRFVWTTFDEAEIFATFFRIDNSSEKNEKLKETAPSTPAAPPLPVIYSNSVGMAWISDVALADDKKTHIYIIGPVFLDDYSAAMIKKSLEKLQLSVRERHHFRDLVDTLPVVSLNRFYEYGIMLHYCLWKNRVQATDFVHADAVDIIPEIEHDEKHGSYVAETGILKMVEDGNLKYKEAMNRYAVTGKTGKLSARGALQQAKNTAIIFTALVQRAAIHGGLSSETAFTLGEIYTLKIDSAENIASVSEFTEDMIDDFVRRVHRIKTTKEDSKSPQIRETCEYIDLHISEKNDIHTLAERLGYTDYYFSTKFKKETGMTVRNYVMKQKIEKAKNELLYTQKTVQDISTELGFNEQSYFNAVFHRQVGMTPVEYRSSHPKTEG